MELRDFISETLIQIVQGINDAQKALKETECVINPRNIEQGDYAKAIIKNKAHVVQDVSFNIALTRHHQMETLQIQIYLLVFLLYFHP